MDEWLPQRHLARFVVEVIEGLDLPQIEALFVEVLKLARTMGMLRLGTVALDGTKIHANASRHSTLSYGHAKKLEKRLKREVQELLKLADAADIPDGMSIPEELERREARVVAIAEAKKKIEARVAEREQTEYQAKLAARGPEAEAHRPQAARPSTDPAQRHGRGQSVLIAGVEFHAAIIAPENDIDDAARGAASIDALAVEGSTSIRSTDDSGMPLMSGWLKSVPLNTPGTRRPLTRISV